MKISYTKGKNDRPSLIEIHVGDCFMYDNTIFLRTNRFDESGNFSLCINLADGAIEEINPSTSVTPLDVELVVSQ